MSISTENDRLTVIISKELKQSLKDLANQENRSLSNFVVTVLEEYVSNKNEIKQLKNDPLN